MYDSGMGRIWRKAVDGATPWARDNIAFAGIMAVAPAIAIVFYDRGNAIDWRVVRLTLYLYLFAFVLYCVYRTIRAVFGVRGEDRDYAQRLMAHATGEAALMFNFEAQATELILRLEDLWHHWNNAGEVLLHPLADNPLKNMSNYNSIELELRDFKLLYGKHIQRVGLDVPKFTSATLVGGYHSNREYTVILRDLREHARALGEIAQDLHETGVPL
jgi:hypothetical protein